MEDITERVQAEAETKRLASIVENSQDFIAMATPDGRASYVNPAGLEMIGYTLEEALASLDISSSQPDLPPEALETAMKEGVWSGETDLAHKDGHRIRILQVIAAVKDETGDIQHFTTVARDITERVQAEEEILKRAVELQTVAEVSTATATILEPGELLQTVTDLTKSNFGLYHAHIYLLDEVEDTLVLASGAGEAGQQMVAEGWQIPLEREASLVARAARTRQGVIANDVREAPDYMPNPLLPDTRSELAVPMIVGDRLLGVLDVQSDRANHFTDEDVQIQTTLAGQIATALDNARLFEEQQQSEERFRGLYEASPLGIILNDYETGDYLEANDAFVEMFGYSLEELNQLSYWDLTPQKYEPDEQEQIRSMEETRRYGPYQKEYIHKDGHHIPVVLNGVLVTDHKGRKLIWSTVADITYRMEAEQELRRLGIAVEQSVDGIAVADMDGNIQFANPAWAQMHGYSVKEILGKPLNIFHTEEQMQQDVGPFNKQVIATGAHQAEIGHVRKDGTAFPTWMSTTVLTDEEGKPVGLVGTARDISEQKEAEQTRQENEERFRDVALSTSDWVWEVDAQGRYTYCSEKVLDVLGYTAEEMLGKTPFDAMPEEEAARVGEIFGEIVANKQPIVDLENRNITKDGREVYLLTNGVPILDGEGNLLGYRGVDKDITERVRAERERERFTTQLSTAAEIASQVSAILDPDELLNTVIALLKERFNLYYAHFYRLDEAAGELVLSAGYGKPGRTMLKKGHSIPLDREQSLVAQAARGKKSVVVHDVTQDPDFMPNPLLPDTKSEVAVPLISGGQVLGVFDVQHDKTNYFTEGDLNVFSSLAGQVATALRNASLFERLQESKA
jgi:PAS domain S-box-containing protein